MHQAHLSTLHCPFCKSKLQIGNLILEDKKSIIHATTFCSCDIYPIVDGVLYLSKNNIKGAALEFLIKQKILLKKAKDIPFFLFLFPLSNKLAIYIVSFFSKHNIFKNLSFNSFIKLFSSIGIYEKSWANYLLTRDQQSSFLAAKITNSIIEKNSVILDAGCGAGHLLNELKEKTKEEKIFAIESSLPGIYLAKKYFCKAANYIYLDMNYPLPFRSSFFDYIVSSDVLHLISNKKLVGKEWQRILKKNGVITLNNLHNKYFARRFKDPIDYPESPSGYGSYFSNLNYWVFSETDAGKGLVKHIPKKMAEKKNVKLIKFTLILSRRRDFGKDIGSVPTNS